MRLSPVAGGAAFAAGWGFAVKVACRSVDWFALVLIAEETGVDLEHIVGCIPVCSGDDLDWPWDHRAKGRRTADGGPGQGDVRLRCRIPQVAVPPDRFMHLYRSMPVGSFAVDAKAHVNCRAGGHDHHQAQQQGECGDCKYATLLHFRAFLLFSGGIAQRTLGKARGWCASESTILRRSNSFAPLIQLLRCGTRVLFVRQATNRSEIPGPWPLSPVILPLLSASACSGCCIDPAG